MTLEPKTAGCLAGAFSACMTRFGCCTHVHRTRKALASLSFLLIPNLSSGVSGEGEAFLLETAPLGALGSFLSLSTPPPLPVVKAKSWAQGTTASLVENRANHKSVVYLFGGFAYKIEPAFKLCLL